MTTPSVFGGASAGVSPFQEVATEYDTWTIKEHVGEVVQVTVLGVGTQDTKFAKAKPYAEVTIKNAEGETFERIRIFSNAVPKQLAALTGQTVLAKVVDFPTDFGNNGYKFGTPEKAEVEAFAKATERAPF